MKKFLAFYGSRKFITVLTKACHLSLSWANSIQSPQPLPTSWRFILILYSHLRLGLPNGLLPTGFPTKNLVHTSPFLRTCHTSRQSQSSWFYYPHKIGWSVQIIEPLIMYFFPLFSSPVPLRATYSPQHPQPIFLPQCQKPIFTFLQNNR